MQTGWGRPQRVLKVSRVMRAPADIDRPPSSNKFLRSRVTHNCVQYSLSQGVGGYCHAASCAIGSKGIKCVVYRIVHKSTASQHVIVEPREVKHKETQGRSGRHLHTKFAPENLQHHRTSAIMLQAITSAATATKDTDIGSSMSPLEAMVCAPTVKDCTECSSTHPRCGQRLQAREIAVNSVCRGI